MTRTPIAYASADVSALARSLRQQLVELGEMPSHVQLLNMLAKARGFRNFQHLKSETVSSEVPAAAPARPPVDEARVARIAGHFDANGALLRWPSRTNHQALCVWVLWARYPADAVMDERSISAWLNEHHEFGDAALLRRTMVNMRLVRRTQDGREYRRIEQEPPAELPLLLSIIDAPPRAQTKRPVSQ